MFTLSGSRATDDAKQAIVDGCKGFVKKHRVQGNTKAFPPPTSGLLWPENTRVWAEAVLLQRQAPWRKRFNTATWKTIRFIVKAHFNRHNGATFTNRGRTCWLKGNGVMQILLHAFCISVKSSLHYTYMCFVPYVPVEYIVLQTPTWISSVSIALV